MVCRTVDKAIGIIRAATVLLVGESVLRCKGNGQTSTPNAVSSGVIETPMLCNSTKTPMARRATRTTLAEMVVEGRLRPTFNGEGSQEKALGRFHRSDLDWS